MVCTNDPPRAASIVGLAVGTAAFADDLANIRDDHRIDAPRIGQVVGSTISVQITGGPWCNEEFTWWLIEADDVAVADVEGAIDPASRGSVSGWIAEIDQFGLTNLSADRSTLGFSPDP